MFSNRDASTLLDKLVTLLMRVAGSIDRQVLLVADAYYASGKVITPLLALPSATKSAQLCPGRGATEFLL